MSILHVLAHLFSSKTYDFPVACLNSTKCKLSQKDIIWKLQVVRENQCFICVVLLLKTLCFQWIKSHANQCKKEMWNCNIEQTLAVPPPYPLSPSELSIAVMVCGTHLPSYCFWVTRSLLYCLSSSSCQDNHPEDTGITQKFKGLCP